MSLFFSFLLLLDTSARWLKYWLIAFYYLPIKTKCNYVFFFSVVVIIQEFLITSCCIDHSVVMLFNVTEEDRRKMILPVVDNFVMFVCLFVVLLGHFGDCFFSFFSKVSLLTSFFNASTFVIKSLLLFIWRTCVHSLFTFPQYFLLLFFFSSLKKKLWVGLYYIFFPTKRLLLSRCVFHFVYSTLNEICV